MPESDDTLAKRFRSAVCSVETNWHRCGLTPARLNAKELAAYRSRDPMLGWRFWCEFLDQPRRIDVLVTADFPFRPARIALVDRPAFLLGCILRRMAYFVCCRTMRRFRSTTHTAGLRCCSTRPSTWSRVLWRVAMRRSSVPNSSPIGITPRKEQTRHLCR